MVGAIELWTYRLFTNDVLYFEEVLKTSEPDVGPSGNLRQESVGCCWKKAAGRITGSYAVEEHLDGTQEIMRADISRDVSDVDHHGTGDLEVSTKSHATFKAATPFIHKRHEQSVSEMANIQDGRLHPTTRCGDTCSQRASGWDFLGQRG